MNTLCRRLGPLSAFLTLLPSLGRAENPPLPLRTTVESTDLIVRCKTEVEGKTVKYRVVETWKGKYSPDLFYHNPDLGPDYHRPPPGYVYVQTLRGNDPLPPNGQDAIYFLAFHREPQWANGKLLPRAPTVVSKGGKILYPPGGSKPPDRKDYASEEEFREAKDRHEVLVLWGRTSVPEEYTVEGFKQAVLDAVKRQMQDPTKNK